MEKGVPNNVRIAVDFRLASFIPCHNHEELQNFKSNSNLSDEEKYTC